MTHPKLSALSLIVAVLLCCGLAQAQQEKPTAANVEANEVALRKKAYELLESLASQIGTLQSAENRARLGSNIAASLWSHDEQRARGLLVSVEADIRAGMQTADEDGQTDEQTIMVFLKLRMDTVERITKHDADLALAFLKATELDPNRPRPYGVAELERNLELRLAKQIAADKPEIALKLGRQSLARGSYDDVLSLLSQLQKKHRPQALTLYKEIVSKLRDVSLGFRSPAFEFAMRLAHSFKPPAVEEPTYRDLINLLITLALQNGCANKIAEEDERVYFCAQLGSLLPQMEQIDPVRAAQLERWKPEERSGWSAEGYQELRDLVENGTVDEVLALAQKYPEMSSYIYFVALMKAEEAGDTARARKIATDHIDNLEDRQRVMARLDRAQMWDSMNEEKLDEAQRVLAAIPKTESRIGFLLELANRTGANDRKTALKLLKQASDMVDTMKPGKEQTGAEMGLAMMYCLEKSDRGLERMQSLLPKLNDLVSAAVKLDSYENQYLREGEWNMSSGGSVGSLLTLLSQNSGYFAWCDFDRAVSLASQFERPEIRLMAQLKLAQAILAGPPKRTSTLRLR